MFYCQDVKNQEVTSQCLVYNHYNLDGELYHLRSSLIYKNSIISLFVASETSEQEVKTKLISCDDKKILVTLDYKLAALEMATNFDKENHSKFAINFVQTVEIFQIASQSDIKSIYSITASLFSLKELTVLSINIDFNELDIMYIITEDIKSRVYKIELRTNEARLVSTI